MVRFRLLGGIDLRDENRTELRTVLAQPKRLALLAYLAISSPRGACRRDTILALFWPELDQERARKALNKGVHFLRQALGDDVIISRSADDLAISSDRLWCDVAAFDSAIKANDPAAAKDLYGGDLLPGFFVEDAQPFEEWLQAERARTRSAAARASRSLAEQNEQEGRLTAAVNCARYAVELSADDERAVRELLELLARLGDRAGALQAYDTFARRLADEYEAEPSDETKAVIARVRARDEAGTVSRVVAADGEVPNEHARSAQLRDRLQAALGGLYTLEEELEGGGMSRVFVAREIALGRRVVLKVLSPDFAEGVSVARFKREIQIAAQLSHPHIVPVLSAGEAAGLPYYTMPLVHGESLRQRLGTEAAVSIAEAIALLQDVARALDHAHSHNVVHRDIKPDNVLLSAGSALVTDFGIAKAIAAARADPGDAPITEAGVIVGTSAYMAPEQATGDPHMDHLVDIYAFGVMAYELLAGLPPFHSMRPHERLAAHLTEAPRSIRALRADTPPEFAALVMQCLAKKPGERPPSATVLVRSLDAIASGEVMRDWRVPAPSRRRTAMFLGVGVATLVALLFGLRAFGIEFRTSLLASGAVAPNEQLIVADFTTRGGVDSALGVVAAQLIRTDLVGSKVVGVMPARRIGQTLREMQAAPDTRVDLPTALEIAERRGTRAVVHGDITPLGAGFVVTLRLVATTSGDELTAMHEIADEPNELIGVLGRLTRALRRRIGESLRDVRATPELPHMTTTSLEALKKYMVTEVSQSHPTPDLPDARGRMRLLEEAVALDSNFASAWRRLSAAYDNLGYPRSVVDSAATRAFRAHDHLSPNERGLVDARYYWRVAEDRPKAIGIYESFLRQYGAWYGGPSIWANGLMLLHVDRREYGLAEALLREQVDSGLIRVPGIYEDWPFVLVMMGKLQEADAAIQRAEPEAGRLRLVFSLITGQLDSAAIISTRLRESDDLDIQNLAWAGRFVVDVTQGRIASGMRALARSRAVSASLSAPLFALLDSIRAAEMDVMPIERRERAVNRLDANFTEPLLRTLAPVDRPYLRVAAAYAKSRRPDRARAVLAQFDRDVRDTLVRRRSRYHRQEVLAEIALAEDSARAAVSLFRQADMRPDGPNDSCAACFYLRLARALDAAQYVDSALFYYERYLTTPNYRFFSEIIDMKAEPIGWVHYRLGELYDAQNNRPRARVHYSKVAELWKNADADLQPKVAEARRRAALN